MNSQTLRDIENADDLQMKEILLAILKWFKKKSLANPFNYNFGFEFIQAVTHGFRVAPVGGGSDGISLMTQILPQNLRQQNTKDKLKMVLINHIVLVIMEHQDLIL